MQRGIRGVMNIVPGGNEAMLVTGHLVDVVATGGAVVGLARGHDAGLGVARGGLVLAVPDVCGDLF